MIEATLSTSSPNSTRAAWHSSHAQVTDKNPEVIKEIPWPEIWTPLAVAKRRGNSQIAAVFLNSLFEEALFDDEGAWVAAGS